MREIERERERHFQEKPPPKQNLHNREATLVTCFLTCPSCLVAVDPPAKSESLFGGFSGNPSLISTKKLTSKDPAQYCGYCGWPKSCTSC